MKYTCHIILPEFSFPSVTENLTEENFNSSLATQILKGGDVGLWSFGKTNGKFRTSTRILAYYATSSHMAGKNQSVRAGKTVIAFWELTHEWATRCCDCGCNSCDDKCQCCCESCKGCGDCACCCEHSANIC